MNLVISILSRYDDSLGFKHHCKNYLIILIIAITTTIEDTIINNKSFVGIIRKGIIKIISIIIHNLLAIIIIANNFNITIINEVKTNIIIAIKANTNFILINTIMISNYYYYLINLRS